MGQERGTARAVAPPLVAHRYGVVTMAQAVSLTPELPVA